MEQPVMGGGSPAAPKASPATTSADGGPKDLKGASHFSQLQTLPQSLTLVSTVDPINVGDFCYTSVSAIYNAPPAGVTPIMKHHLLFVICLCIM